LENLPFEHKQTSEKTLLKIFTNFLIQVFFAHLNKATIKSLCCEVSHQKLIFLGDMDDYINVPKVGFPRSGHIYLLWLLAQKFALAKL